MNARPITTPFNSDPAATELNGIDRSTLAGHRYKDWSESDYDDVVGANTTIYGSFENLDDFTSIAKNVASKIKNEIEKSASSHPYLILAAAVGIGYLVGELSGRKTAD